jgi:Flp pilus assembly protein TadG
MRWRDDRGSSVADFVLMSTLLVLLLFGVMQVGLYMYARTITAAAAADGARYGAAAGLPADAAARRADAVLHSGLHSAAAGVGCTSGFGADAASGLAISTVHCSGHVRSVFVPLGTWLGIDVTASALREGTG